MTKARNIADIGSNDVLDTDANGVDVTGSITADGLTVDGTPIRFNSTAPMLYFMETGVADSNHRIRQNAGNLYFQKLSDDENTATTNMVIDGGTGDITMYKDDGSTAGVTFDASSGFVDIGGSSAPRLTLTSSSGPYGYIESNTVGSVGIGADGGNSGLATNLTFLVDTVEVARLKQDSFVINEGSNNIDFRVEGDSNSNLFFVDAGFDSGQGAIGVGTNSPARASGFGGSQSVLQITGCTVPELRLTSSTSGQGDLSIFASNSGATAKIVNANGGIELSRGGTNQLTVSNGVVINDGSNDYDFRVESNNNTHALFVDGGNDVVGIGTNDIRTPSKLIVGGSQSFVGSDGNFSGGGNRAFIDIENSATRHMRLGYTSGGSSSSGGIRFYVASSSSATSAQMALTPEGRLAVGGTDAGKSRLNIQGETGYGKGVLTRQNQVYTFVRNFVNTGSANSSIELCTIGYDHANWNSMWFKVEVFNDYYQSGGESAWILDSQAGTARQLYSQNPSGSWSSSTTQINSNLTRRVWTWNGNQYRSYAMRVTFGYDPVNTDPTAGKVRFTTGNYGGY